VQEQRAARYGLMRGYFHGADDDSVDELDLQRLESVTLTEDAAMVGERIDRLKIQLDEVELVSLRQANGAVVIPQDTDRLAAGDTLVLSGRPQALSRARTLVLQG